MFVLAELALCGVLVESLTDPGQRIENLIPDNPSILVHFLEQVTSALVPSR